MIEADAEADGHASASDDADGGGGDVDDDAQRSVADAAMIRRPLSTLLLTAFSGSTLEVNYTIVIRYRTLSRGRLQGKRSAVEIYEQVYRQSQTNASRNTV